MKSKQQRINELLNAVDRHRLQQNGVPLHKFMKVDFSSPDKPKSQSDIKLDKALFKLHHLKIEMLKDGRIK